MAYLWILFTVLQLGVISFALVSLWRLNIYINRYRFDETKYTLLFGFVHLKWIEAFYAIFAVLWVIAGYALFVRI